MTITRRIRFSELVKQEKMQSISASVKEESKGVTEMKEREREKRKPSRCRRDEERNIR